MKYNFYLFILCFVIISSSAFGQAEFVKIKTIAGTGTQGYSGDGYNALGAELHAPIGVAVDNSGNVYIDDYLNYRVRKINGATDLITTIAGNGTPGNNGNGSVATNCEIVPRAVAVDFVGNVYIADPDYSVVRKVNIASGLISTVAGNNTWGYSGDGGPATLATLRVPNGLAVDMEGNLYIADAGNHSVRKVDKSGTIYTVAGMDSLGYSGDGGLADTARLDSPTAVAVDRWGNLYITDYGNNVIRKVDTGGFISTFAGSVATWGYGGDGGMASIATLNNPMGLAVDTFGNVFIADADNNRIREVDSFGIIHTVVGNGTAGYGGDYGFVDGANLHNPYGIALDVYGNLYIADANNERVRKTYDYLAVNSMPATSAGIVAYPNPSVGQVTVGGVKNADKICVYDIVGNAVTDVMTVGSNGAYAFNVSTLPSGIYLLQVWDAQNNKKATVQLAKD